MKTKFASRTKTKYVTDRRTYKLMTIIDKYPYGDECWSRHRSRGKRNWKKKQLFEYQVRKYRSWKYNRLTRWK